MPGEEQRGSWRRSWLFLVIAVCIVVLDQITKQWVRSNIILYELIPVFGPVSLTNVRNTGSAFGLFVNQAFLLAIIGVVGIIAILLFYRYFSKSNLLGISALGLVFGGAIGNLIDRFRFGYVTDFIDVRLWHDYHWPSFNVADSAITVGCLLLIIFIFLTFGKSDGSSSKAGS
jgi:signal peptidase II